MRKDDRLRRSELFLPPPSINKHRPIPSDEVLEERTVTNFIGAMFFALIVGFIATSMVLGTGVWFVLRLLGPTQLIGWDITWVNCTAVTGVFLFCRSWMKAVSAS